MKIKEEEFNQPTPKKKGWPTNVGGKRNTPKKVATKKEDLKKNLMKKKVMV